MSARISCLAPGCRRTHANHEGYSEWLCAKHWSLVPKKTRSAYHRARRRMKSSAALGRLWSRCVRIATIETLQGFGP